MHFSPETTAAIYFGWAMAHINGAAAVVNRVIRERKSLSAEALAGAIATLQELQSVSTQPPIRPLPANADQLEAAVAELYDRYLATVEALATGTGDVATLYEAAVEALERTESAAHAFFGP